jgi:hypothetical protein
VEIKVQAEAVLPGNKEHKTMTRRYGSQSMIEPLRTVLVKRPDEAFAVDDPQE